MTRPRARYDAPAAINVALLHLQHRLFDMQRTVLVLCGVSGVLFVSTLLTLAAVVTR